MPVTHLVHVILRPGVQSIQVQYQVNNSGIWITWSDNERIIQGATVRFTVTTYPTFTLTEWEAYYADEYDDTVDITLSPITGQSAWEFTMPSADVYIRCEAEVQSSYTGDEWPGINPFTPYYSGMYEILTFFNSASAFMSKYLELCRASLSIYGFPPVVENRITELYSSSSTVLIQSYVVDPGYRRDIFIYSIPSITSNIPYTLDTPYTNGWLSRFRPPDNTRTIRSDTVMTEIVNGSYDGMLETIGFAQGGTNNHLDFTNVSSALINLRPGPSLTVRTIRYIMSPDNSGEIDASSPSEFEEDATEFTFKWRIKATYEFKRLTPFAVGEGSLEDDISYSLDSYDGDTRTYTFTVTQIPDWAIGVRVLIETIFVPDDQNASGTNATDGPVGGNGTFDDTSDDVPLPAIPTGVSAADSGFVTLFRPTIQQVKELGNYLWSNLDEFWENLQKIFTNPMDYIIGLNTFPVNPLVDADRAIYIGNWLTNITMPPVRNQFYEFNCGTVNISEYFGSFLDYASNTSARIMLPFIGDRDLNVNEIMNKTLHLWYRINLLSGECLAVLTINNNVYYQWDGNCAIPIPLTGSDWSRLYGGIGRMVGAGLGLAAGGLIGMGISGAMSAMATAGSNTNYVPFTGVDNQTHYRRVGPHTPYDRASQLTPGPIKEPPREEFGLSIPAKAALAAGTAHIIGNNIMGASSRVAHSGGMTGGIGIMGNRTPFIVLEYPNVNLPENYKHLYGYPSNQYAVLGNLSGYTECKAVMFESTTATDDEVELIIRTLKSGVYL